ncbi:GNAT family protein [Colletotrichum kahawae]|uniref:GNAT family protein n=1 Tax=Colletotrichum kahawae TaxID=34407 RepID=A0AAE0DDS7_COLKA|nr:GNAT family protein [Colletotrichum kahawae]
MPLQVSLAQPSEALAISTLVSEELLHDRTTRAAMRLPETQGMREMRARNVARLIRTDASARFIKVSDSDTNRVLGYARWQVPLTFPPSPLRAHLDGWTPEKDAETAEQKAAAVAASVTSMKLWNYILDALKEKRDKYVDEQKCLVLGLLDVYPDVRGQGAARKLLEWGLQQADETGSSAYLETAVTLQPFVEKFGWVTVDEVAIDFDGFDDVSETGIQKWVCMLRQPSV